MPLYPWRLSVGGITQVGSSALLASQTTMRCAAQPIILQFLDALTDQPVLLPGVQLICVVKAKGVFDGDSLVPTVTFATDTDKVAYTGNIDFITTALNDLFKVNGSTADDVASIDLVLAFAYSLDSGSTWTPSNNIALTLTNNVARGTESSPDGLPGPEDWAALNSIRFLSAVVGATGGGSTKLDGFQTTAGRSYPRTYFYYDASLGLQIYELDAGTDAATADIVHPTDYDAVTNQLVYRKRG